MALPSQKQADEQTEAGTYTAPMVCPHNSFDVA
jgi:hypothetical protein